MEFSTKLAKIQLSTFILICVGNFFNFIAILTPSWQPPTRMLIEVSKVDYGCIVRAPPIVGWHYAILILLTIAFILAIVSAIAIVLSYLRPKFMRVATVVMVTSLFFSCLLIFIGLVVFMINAEMLESKYLIGVKNTFEKYYGYSFYMSCISFIVMVFGALSAIAMTTSVFFFRSSPDSLNHDVNDDYYRTSAYMMNSKQNLDPLKYNMMRESTPTSIIPEFTDNDPTNVPRYAYNPSETSFPTRTFLSY